jgi:putative ABC transport system permease protein
MLKYNLLLLFRNIKRFRTTFFINLIGLTTGLTSAILIYLWVTDELAMDKFHEHDARLVHVMMNIKDPEGISTGDHTPGQLGEALKREMPEVELQTSVVEQWGAEEGIITVNEKKATGIENYVTNDFFKVFSFRLVQGDKNTVLNSKSKVLISDELANTLFGRPEFAIGKAIDWEKGDFNGSYEVSGVFEKPSRHSSKTFDILFHFDLLMEKYPVWMEWGNSSSIVYLLLNEGTDLERFNEKIRNFITSKDKNVANTIFARRYSDQHLYNSYSNGVLVGGRILYVRLFSIVAIFILIIASVNFMNLSTARVATRIKEIGIKKTVGATRKTLFIQHIGESLFMSLLALSIALLLVDILLPQFNLLTGKELSLRLDTKLIIALVSIALITGLIAGSYPAIYLSGFSPAVVLKGKLTYSFTSQFIRKGLVVFQFVISIVLIICVGVVYQQIAFIQNKNLGYNRDNILYFNSQGVDETFMQRLRSLPGVENATTFNHNLTGDHGTAWGFSWDDQKPGGDQIKFNNLEVGSNFVETFGMQIVEGENFSKDLSWDQQIILNEKAIQEMDLKNPVGKTFHIWRQDRKIVGIVKNFHFESLYEEVKPCFLFLIPDVPVAKVMVRLKPNDIPTTLKSLDQFHKEYNEGLAFDYKFLHEDFATLYAAEQRVSSLSKYFALIAIITSCLGLFGLAAFTAERRTKEIGIRKVLGSGQLQVVFLLSGEFLKLVLVAIVIAIPVSYLISHSWLDAFAFKIQLKASYFLAGGFIAIMIAWLTVSTQAFKASRVNPAQCLKDE